MSITILDHSEGEKGGEGRRDRGTEGWRGREEGGREEGEMEEKNRREHTALTITAGNFKEERMS